MSEVIQMPDVRRHRLKELETVIASGWEGMVQLGEALREIRDDGLYLELDGGITFEQYCKSRWALAARTAYQRIDAADIADAVRAIAQTTTPILNEAVSRELAPVLHQQGADKVAEAWRKISERYRDSRPPTAREVHKVLMQEGYRPRVGHASTGKPNARILLGQVGDRIAATERRLNWFLSREAPNVKVSPSTRKLAAAYAERCDELSRLLDNFAEGRESE